MRLGTWQQASRFLNFKRNDGGECAQQIKSQRTQEDRTETQTRQPAELRKMKSDIERPSHDRAWPEVVLLAERNRMRCASAVTPSLPAGCQQGSADISNREKTMERRGAPRSRRCVPKVATWLPSIFHAKTITAKTECREQAATRRPERARALPRRPSRKRKPENKS